MRRRRRGLSLTEAILAATLGSLVALMVLSILPGAMRGMVASAEELQGADLASEMMSRLESLPFGTLALGDWDGRVPTAANDAGQPTQFPPSPYPGVQRRFVEGSRERVIDYQVRVTVEAGKDRSGAAATDLKVVRVAVFWKLVNAAGVATEKTLDLSTMVVDEP